MIVQIDFSAPLTLEEIIAFGKTPEEGNNHFDSFIINNANTDEIKNTLNII